MRKLPVLDTFSHAVKSTWGNLGFAFHASWPWLLLLLPLNMWADASLPEIKPPDASGNIPPEQANALLTFYVVAFVSMIIYASIAVSWHRYVLKDEVPQGAARLRMDSMVWRYVGNSILVILMVTLMVLPLGFFLGMFSVIFGGFNPVSFSLFIAVAVLLALPITYRFSIKLPAIAVERPGFRFGDAWNVTRGNMTQLMLLGAMSFGVVLVAGFVLGGIETILVKAGGDMLRWPVILVRHIVNWVMAIFTITMLTSLYGFFVEEREF